MLLNIVKQRYLDMPVYLDVSSVVSSYSLETGVNLEAKRFPRDAASSNATLGVSGSYSESPTISYAPLSGERLVNSLLRPIPPETVFAMINGGRRVDFLLRATLRSINGVYAASTLSPAARQEDPAFARIVEALGRIEQADALGLRIEKHGEHAITYVLFHGNRDAETQADIRQVKELLGLDPSRGEFLLVFGSARRPDQIALNTRSIQQVLGELASGVEVPEQDLREGRASPRARAGGDTPRLMHVHSGDAAPTDAFAAVPYRGRWFWVDDRDLASKRMSVFLMMFMSITESGALPQAPVLTIPVR